MDEKKKGIIFGVLALVAGIAMIAYGVVNLMKDKEPVEDNDNNPPATDGPSITVTEDEVKTWLTDNEMFVYYFTNYNEDWDLDKATEEDFGNIFAWYFLSAYDHGEGETPTDSQYRVRYTMPKADAEVFMQNYVGVPLDMVNLSAITLSNAVKFTSDDENFYADVTISWGIGGDCGSKIVKVDILSDSEINVDYGLSCSILNPDDITSTKQLTFRKSDNGFTILRATTIGDTGTDNNNLEDNNQTENENTNQETENNETKVNE